MFTATAGQWQEGVLTATDTAGEWQWAVTFPAPSLFFDLDIMGSRFKCTATATAGQWQEGVFTATATAGQW